MGIAAVAQGMEFAGSMTEMAGDLQEGYGKQAAANYNAQVKEQQAQMAISQANEDERRLRVDSRKVAGGIRAQAGSSGVSLEGSALDVLEESVTTAELDALTIKHRGQLQAWALRAGASLDIFEGEQYALAGRTKFTGKFLKYASSKLGGGGSPKGETTTTDAGSTSASSGAAAGGA